MNSETIGAQPPAQQELDGRGNGASVIVRFHYDQAGPEDHQECERVRGPLVLDLDGF
jgi:hypothetical protein